MKIKLEKPLRKATVTLLLRGDEVLLAMKKRGFGVGKWNGVGGKQDKGEDIEDTATRETEEEIGVRPHNLKKVAIFDYVFSGNEDLGLQVHVFTATEWDGMPTESEEMKPEWFEMKNIPYENMWVDDEIWMPKVFAGALLKGTFEFGSDEKIIEYCIEEVEGF